MSQELLACFDRDRNELPSLPKNIALSQPYPCFHAISKVWVINKNGEILCSQKSEGMYDGGKWQTYLRDYVLGGDSSTDTTVRIVREQLDLKIDPQKLVSVGEGRSDSHSHFYSHYGLLWEYSYQARPNFTDIQKIKWLSFEKYANLVLNFPTLWCNEISMEEYQALKIMLKIN